MNLKFKPSVGETVVVNGLFFMPLFLIIFYVFFLLSRSGYMNNYFLAGLSFLFLLFGFAYFVVINNTRNKSYFVTDKFVSMKRKFISEEQVDIPASEITNIDYSIGWFWDKMFGTGSILVYTAGSSGADLIIYNVRDVRNIYERINELINVGKSANISEKGNFTSTKSELAGVLVERVKPNAKIGTFVSFLGKIGSLFLFCGYIGFSIIDGGDGFTSLESAIPFILPIVGFFLISSLITLILTYKAFQRKSYDFYGDKLEYYDGFFTKNKSTVPFERITNIDERRGLLDRIFGTYTIGIETAGSGASEIVIAYVEDGEKIVAKLKEVLKKDGRE